MMISKIEKRSLRTTYRGMIKKVKNWQMRLGGQRDPQENSISNELVSLLCKGIAHTGGGMRFKNYETYFMWYKNLRRYRKE